MEKTINTELNEWQTFFKSARKICKENKLREFQFKFLHRIDVNKKELFRFEIKQNSDFLEDSMDNTFVNCQFTQSFRKSIFRWFNSKNNSNLLPSLKKTLFGLSENLLNNSRLTAKLNYTLLFVGLYISVDFIQGACTESIDSQVQGATTQPPHPWNLWLVNHFPQALLVGLWLWVTALIWPV